MTGLNELYGFKQVPFTKSIAARDLFPSSGHREAPWPTRQGRQGRLHFALLSHTPALLTGDVGTGKSTAIRAFVQTLDRNVHVVVYLSNPHLGVSAL
jgi:general secretion pathway protein A